MSRSYVEISGIRYLVTIQYRYILAIFNEGIVCNEVHIPTFFSTLLELLGLNVLKYQVIYCGVNGWHTVITLFQNAMNQLLTQHIYLCQTLLKLHTISVPNEYCRYINVIIIKKSVVEGL